MNKTLAAKNCVHKILTFLHKANMNFHENCSNRTSFEYINYSWN